MCRFIPQIDLESCEFLNFRLSVRSQPCPHCHRSEFVKAHGYLRASRKAVDKIASPIRALRFMCSARNGDSGCGKTFSIYWDHVIPHASLNSAQVGRIIETHKSHPDNLSLSELITTDHAGCSPSTVYRGRKRFTRHLAEIRSTLYLKKPPSKGRYFSSPEVVTLKHLRDVFPKTPYLVTAFQSTFQRVFSQVSTSRFPRCHRFIQPALNLFRAATRDENQWPLFQPMASQRPEQNGPKNHFW